MKDIDVIKALIIYLRDNGYPCLQLDERPDITNRSSCDIDVIAGPFAIEHTSIDTLPEQRKVSSYFASVINGLGEEFSGKLPFRLSICFEYNAVTKGQDGAAILNALKNWIANDSPSLPDGNHFLDNIPGVPFRLCITKKENSLRPGIVFSRFPPSDSTLPDRVKKQFDRKAEKLIKYSDKIKLLLVESDDEALMNKPLMSDAVRKAYPNGLPDGIAQIWYADTSIINTDLEFECCFIR